MIYTVTLNPAIDCVVELNELNIGETNYYQNSYSQIGGKGINVGVILNSLGIAVDTIGFLGDKNKNIFLEVFNQHSLKNDFIFIKDASTRINYKIRNLTTKEETEMNGLGIDIPSHSLTQLLKYLEYSLRPNDIVIGCGSLAKSVPSDIYFQIGQIANSKQALFLLDTAKQPLKEGLKSEPYLIKPNIAEICELLELPILKHYVLKEIISMVQKIGLLGAKNILLSMGKDGSYYFEQTGKIYQVGIAKGELVNSVGAGDSMLAGIAFGLTKKLDLKTTLAYGAASGAATAFTKWLAEKENIEKFVSQIEVNEIEGVSWK